MQHYTGPIRGGNCERVCSDESCPLTSGYWWKRESGRTSKTFLKGGDAQEWTHFIEVFYANQGHTLKARAWTPQFIEALWEHTQRVWQFRNMIYYADHNGCIARYKEEEWKIYGNDIRNTKDACDKTTYNTSTTMSYNTTSDTISSDVGRH
jgi:hypothetical protein